jgi:NADH dehydrogenase FAD-containing subunit
VARLLEHDYEVTLVDAKKYFEFTPSVLRALVEPEHAKVIQKPHLHYLHHANVLHGVTLSVRLALFFFFDLIRYICRM